MTANRPRSNRQALFTLKTLRALPAVCAAIGSTLAVSSVAADKVIQQQNVSTLTTFAPTAKSAAQQVLSAIEYRATGIDGVPRVAAAYPWQFAPNPRDAGWGGKDRLGDVRLGTGTYSPTRVDLILPADVPIPLSRSYNARLEENAGGDQSDGFMGKNWFANWAPEIQITGNEVSPTAADMVYLHFRADAFLEFQRSGASNVFYKGVNGAAGHVEYVAGSPDLYVYRDLAGTQTYFFGGDTASNAADWQLWKVVDPDGNTAYVGDSSSASTAVTNGYDSTKSAILMFDSAGRKFILDYSTIDGTKRLINIQVKVDHSGTWDQVVNIDYSYYGSSYSTYGDNGNLRTVTVMKAVTDSTFPVDNVSLAVKEVTNENYRYYLNTWADADGTRGKADLLMYIIGPGGTEAYGSGFDTAASSSITDESDYFFEYTSNTDLRLASFFADGDCGCGGGTNGTTSLTFGAKSGFTDDVNAYDEEWKYRVVKGDAEGAYETNYLDETYQLLSVVKSDADPASASNFWATEVVRDANGMVDKIHSPANITTYVHSTAAFTRSTTAGLITAFTRINTSADTDGMIEYVKHQKGTDGTLYPETKLTYTTTTKTWSNDGDSYTNTRPFTATRRVYTDTLETAGSEAYDETTFTYTYWTGDAGLMPKSIKTAYPKVSTADNGRGDGGIDEAIWSYRYMRKDGTTAFTQKPAFEDTSSADRIYVYTEYSDGRLVTRIEDATTNHASDYEAGYDPSTNFGITESGDGTHRKTTYTYDDMARPDQVTLADGRVTENYYSVLNDGRPVTLRIPRVVAGSPDTRHGPFSYTVVNDAGKPEFQGTAALSSSGSTSALTAYIDETSSDPIAALDVGTLVSMNTKIYNNTGARLDKTRTYYLIPGSGAGTDGTNFNETEIGYDNEGKQWRQLDASGTITRKVSDALDRPIEQWVGTNDASFDGGSSSGTDNMVKISATEYDLGSAGGNSYVTQTTAIVDESDDANAWDDDRVTTYKSTYRGFTNVILGSDAPYTVHDRDAMGRIRATGQFSSTSGLTASTDPTSTTTNRVGLAEYEHDAMGRQFRTKVWEIVVSTGATSGSLTSESWYNERGQLVKQVGDQFTKYEMDRQDRNTESHNIGEHDDTTFAHSANITGDTVLETVQTRYESTNSNNVIMAVRLSRFHDYTGTGSLDTNADADDLELTATNIVGKSRADVSYNWYDALDRRTDTVRYGSYNLNGTSGPTSFDGNSLSVPSRSDTALRTTWAYDTWAGADNYPYQEVTDALGTITRTQSDHQGRPITITENYTNGTPGQGTDDQEDRVTKYEYTDNLRTKVTADMPGTQTDQDTIYTYGSTKGATDATSRITTGHLLQKIQYPDSAGGTDVVTYAYNAQSQRTYQKDQLGTETVISYDTSGREAHRGFTLAGGSPVDDAVLRVSTTYNSRGLPATIGQYNNADPTAGAIISEVANTYNDWSRLSKEEQDHNSAAGGTLNFDVEYAYETDIGARRTLRQTTLTYPDGTAVTYDYGTAGGTNDDSSRVQTIKIGATAYLDYEYMGTATVVSTDMPEPDIRKRIHRGNASTSSDPYADWDRFGRVTSEIWDSYKAGGSPDFIDMAISYDEGGNITDITDSVHTGWDVLYGINELNQVTGAEEGTLSGGSITSGTREETWTYSQLGLWSQHVLDLNHDGDGADTNELDETNSLTTGDYFNAANEWLKRDGTPDIDLSYDAAGNMTSNGTHDFTYDAMNRLVKVEASSATVNEYTYDALGRLISFHYDTTRSGGGDPDSVVNGDDPMFHVVYDGLQPIATYVGSDALSDPKEHFYYEKAGFDGGGGGSYMMAQFRWDRDDNTAWYASSDGTMEASRYKANLWNGSLGAVVTSAGNMVEWAKFYSYGVSTSAPTCDADGDFDVDITDIGLMGGTYVVIEDANLDGTLDSQDTLAALNIIGTTMGRGVLSYVGNRFGQAGYHHDLAVDEFRHVNARFMDSEIGRWGQRDPIGYVDGLNLYQYVKSNPLKYNDPTGLAAGEPPCGGIEGLGGGCGGGDCAQCGLGLASILMCIASPNKWQCIVSLAGGVANARACMRCFSWLFNPPPKKDPPDDDDKDERKHCHPSNGGWGEKWWDTTPPKSINEDCCGCLEVGPRRGAACGVCYPQNVDDWGQQYAEYLSSLCEQQAVDWTEACRTECVAMGGNCNGVE